MTYDPPKSLRLELRVSSFEATESSGGRIKETKQVERWKHGAHCFSLCSFTLALIVSRGLSVASEFAMASARIEEEKRREEKTKEALEVAKAITIDGCKRQRPGWRNFNSHVVCYQVDFSGIEWYGIR